MEFKPGHTVGIDLGTTFSTIAHLDAEGNPVVPDERRRRGRNPQPDSAGRSGHVVVGPSRMRAAMEDPEHVVDRVKRHMGNTEYKRHFRRPRDHARVPLGPDPEKARQDAEKRIGKIGNAVITVPYYFNDVRRKATQDAGRIAGLNVDRHHQRADRRHADLCLEARRAGRRPRQTFERPRPALVYDLGGGTFDVTRRPLHADPLPGAGHRRRRATWAASTGTTGCWTTWPSEFKSEA